MTELEYNYLAHHGILGQRWGRRNGPPYPLDASDHSAVEKKHLSKSLSGKRHEEMYGRNQKSNSEKTGKKDFYLTDQQKKYIKIGAAVAGTALVAYGGYKLAKSGLLDDAVILGRQKATRLLNMNKASGEILGDIQQISKETGFEVRDTPISIIESTKIVNPGYATQKPEFKNNCFSAVTADLLNRSNNGMGLKVQARPATPNEISNGGLSFNEVAKCWKNSSIDDKIIKKDSLKTVDSIKENLSSQIKSYSKNEDGFGMIRVKLAKDSGIGHYIKWEIKNGEVYYSDSLSGSMTKADQYFGNMITGRLSRGIEIMEADGLEIEPSQAVKIVRSL